MLMVSIAGFASFFPRSLFSSRLRKPRSMSTKCPTTTALPQKSRNSLITESMDGSSATSEGVISWMTTLDALSFRPGADQPIKRVPKVYHPTSHTDRSDGDNGVFFFFQAGQFQIDNGVLHLRHQHLRFNPGFFPLAEQVKHRPECIKHRVKERWNESPTPTPHRLSLPDERFIPLDDQVLHLGDDLKSLLD